MIRDLWGHAAVGGVDLRPWLDHGRWPASAPMALRPGPAERAEAPEFAFGDELDQLPLGPVRGGIKAAAHLRLGLRGETVARLEARLGYTHKGTMMLMRGKSPRTAARFAARLAAEATVAHSVAFAGATEAALGCEIPPRAEALRRTMQAIERTTAHLDVLAALAEAVAIAAPASWSARHAEALRRAAFVAFGHRLMMDCVIPGGLAADLAEGGIDPMIRAVGALAADIPALRRVDVLAARAATRLAAIDDSVAAVDGLLRSLPAGAISAALPVASGEAVGFADGPHGDIWHWLRLDHGQIATVFLCDPAWQLWPALEASMAGAQIDDLPVVLASLGLTSSGMDL